MNNNQLTSQPSEGIRLTAIEIHNKDFNRKLRGFDEDQVNEFLDQIIMDYEAFEKQIRDLKEKVAQLSNPSDIRSVNNASDTKQIHQRIRELEIYCFGNAKD